MSLRTRLILMTGAWILLIVLFFNYFIYFYILKKITDAEVELLWNKAQIILRNPEIKIPENWSNPHLLKEFQDPDSLIRIITPTGAIAAQSVSNEQLATHPPVYRTDYHFTVENGLDQLLFIQVPIIENGVQIGLLELGKALDVLGDFMEILATGLMVTTVSVLLFSLVGGVFYTRVIIRPIRQLLETMNTVRSKGQFIQLSSQFTTKNDELGRLGKTFNQMILSLQENDLKQKQFVSDASHELRTPLTVIESYTSLLRRWGGEDPTLRQEALDAIHSETVRLKGLIDSLLHMAEIERQPEIRLRNINLKPLIDATAEQLSLAFKREIRVESASKELYCMADEEKIKQLLIILLDNAIKYSKKPVTIVCKEEANTVILQVKDEGIGVPRRELGQLFERFYRVDKARGRGTGGSGLGLAIAKRIVEQNQGTIRLDSDEGKGMTVTITLLKKEKEA
ncbi:sensor histidine kinase [Paenibacillus naphthalenovorans]|uniref:histidine kinase n=1 Tax=Paenibacillus naphthalenovorans TaxID=162209 RepID=A0A0U2W3Q2_9BACL|nr:HAMP domain-containing sensor histidine kinase [Paenibacillus naphthalenovorans]ALS22029.1 two-component system sensor histidine kinase [Paenibacillus naphthalenovorans]SDJ24949.1 Signal transduction histidine kinase [Paenibacillus naphthalenovorans]